MILYEFGVASLVPLSPYQLAGALNILSRSLNLRFAPGDGGKGGVLDADAGEGPAASLA